MTARPAYAIAAALAGLVACARQTPREAPPPGPTRIEVRGVELHYVERGQGRPVVLVHGASDDLRYWDAQMGPLAERYRVVAYSRRYVWPNRNPLAPPPHSPFVEAEDLAALIDALGLERPHVIGHSYGAFTALALALRRPERPSTLVLSEPPVLSWAGHVPGGKALVERFRATTVTPAGDAFRRGEPEQAMRILLDSIVKPGFFEGLPPDVGTQIMGNARDMEAICTSPDAFPPVPLQDVRRLRIPTLLLTGSRTTPINTIGHRVLVRTLPLQENLVIEGASHEVFVDDPATTTAAVLAFLAWH